MAERAVVTTPYPSLEEAALRYRLTSEDLKQVREAAERLGRGLGARRKALGRIAKHGRRATAPAGDVVPRTVPRRRRHGVNPRTGTTITIPRRLTYKGKRSLKRRRTRTAAG